MIFEGIIGSPFESDIAIDNVTVTEGACSGKFFFFSSGLMHYTKTKLCIKLLHLEIVFEHIFKQGRRRLYLDPQGNIFNEEFSNTSK